MNPASLTIRRFCRIRNTRQNGFTLVEVLVALFVLALGLLGLAMLQSTAMRFGTDSHSRTQATFFAYDIIEKIRLNMTAFSAGNYDVPTITEAKNAISAYATCKDSACKCDVNACSTSALAQYDLGRWYELQDAWLPGTSAAASGDKRATIVRNGNAVTVTIYWKEQDLLKSQVWQAEL